MNGIGERSGNASLEEVLVILRQKGGIDRYDLSCLTTLSHKVEKYSGIALPKNKPVTGELRLARERYPHRCHSSGSRHVQLFFPGTGGRRAALSSR